MAAAQLFTPGTSHKALAAAFPVCSKWVIKKGKGITEWFALGRTVEIIYLPLDWVAQSPIHLGHHFHHCLKSMMGDLWQFTKINTLFLSNSPEFYFFLYYEILVRFIRTSHASSDCLSINATNLQ